SHCIKMWRCYVMIVMILLVRSSLQQDLCSQTILENIAHIVDARISELHIRMNHISSKLNEVVVKQDLNNVDMMLKFSQLLDQKFSNLEEKLPQLLDEKLSIHLENKLPQLLDEKLSSHIEDKISQPIEMKLSNHLEQNISNISGSIQDIVDKQNSSNQELIGDLSDLQDKQTEYIDDKFSVVNTTLSMVGSTIENMKDDIVTIKSDTEYLELEAITFEEIKNITSVLKQKECPVDDGFFQFAGGNPCMKAFPDKSLTWDDAESHCRSQGLALSEPRDAVGLHKYLTERYVGVHWFWVGGRRSESTFTWRRSGGEFPSNSPLWETEYPKTNAIYDCLAFGLNGGDIKRPYWNYICTATYIPLCEVYYE
ncbi:unnamed protein product, partial [Meganyctiphanes norvegica]